MNNPFRFGLAAAGLAGALAIPASAEASARRVPASICFADTDYPGDYLFERGVANQSGWLGRARWVHCPILDDDLYIPGVGTPSKKSATNGLWVDGWDGNNETSGVGDVQVRICQYQPWTSGLYCTSWVQATSGTYTGAYSTNYDATTEVIKELDNPNHNYWYPDLQFSLPRQGVLGNSSTYGYVLY